MFKLTHGNFTPAAPLVAPSLSVAFPARFLRAWRLFRIFFAVHLQRAFSYRIESVIWIINGTIWPLILLNFWSRVGQSSGQPTMETRGVVTYFLLLIVVERLTQVWAMEWVAVEIKEGRFTKRMIRPVHYLIEEIAKDIAEKAQRLSLLLPVFLGLVFAYRQNFSIAVGVGEWLAFFFTEIRGINRIWWLLSSLLTGAMIPIVFLPAFIRPLGLIFFTRYFYSFPIEILLGQVKGEAILTGFLIGLVWLTLLVLAYRLLCRAGIKKYTGVGI